MAVPSRGHSACGQSAQEGTLSAGSHGQAAPISSHQGPFPFCSPGPCAQAGSGPIPAGLWPEMRHGVLGPKPPERKQMGWEAAAVGLPSPDLVAPGALPAGFRLPELGHRQLGTLGPPCVCTLSFPKAPVLAAWESRGQNKSSLACDCGRAAGVFQSPPRAWIPGLKATDCSGSPGWVPPPAGGSFLLESSTG